MRSAFRRHTWLGLTLLLTAAWAVTAWELMRLRKVAIPRAKPEAAADVHALSKRERNYLAELARSLGAPFPEQPNAGDVARLAAQTGVEWHRLRTLSGKTSAAAAADREFAPTFTVTLPLASEMRVTLPSCERFRYTIRNKTDRLLPAPILFQRQRWDTAEDLVASAGFREIVDEVERAVAIWRFVTEHRDHAFPVTQGEEEHDVVKFFALYGYGFCDDAARALSTLAELSGLTARVWFIGDHVHVVAEIFAAGRWRMFDADSEVYFHSPDHPREILGIAELAQDRGAFASMVSRAPLAGYREDYIAAFLDRATHAVKAGGTSGYEIRPQLRGGESFTFTNFHWGRFFAGAYPAPGGRLRNGWITTPLRRAEFTHAGKLEIEALEQGWRMKNSSGATQIAQIAFDRPFPIVGGRIHGRALIRQGRAAVSLEDAASGRRSEAQLTPVWSISLNGLVSVLSPAPTYRYTFSAVLEAGADLELFEGEAFVDFQCAPLAVLPLKEGENQLHAFFPDGCDPSAFELTIATK